MNDFWDNLCGNTSVTRFLSSLALYGAGIPSSSCLGISPLNLGGLRIISLIRRLPCHLV
ncbi:hypothetical protein AG1IA_08004 [Rhizoctonia solani AG-1 IA]|uniref:Uncharacterized protein n=1 Tax=Thanatephorus cucumeris (strain AG1-IA) TaxID=983506 RepID=L8WMF7_THACA|nr:hypothetical protein AG1IA_08004 [Rhizoctonia solani AG-1 IA]